MNGRVRYGSAGFTLVEVLVATAITMAVVAMAGALAVQAQHAWRGDSARADLQQRARVAADRIGRALLEAGAGPSGGPGRGPLVRFLPSILPRRTGRLGADEARVVRRNGFTTIRAVGEGEDAVLLLPAAPDTMAIELTPATGCDLPACGVASGSHILLFDAAANHDVFTVTSVAGSVLTLRHHGAGAHPGYAAGTPVVTVEQSSYFLDPADRTLRVYDGDASNLPVVDDVVEMVVSYYGSAGPPREPRPGAGVSNCLYESDGSFRAALLPVLSGGGGSLVPLAADTLADGPWCGAGANRFDADLLRVRRVRVAVRLQAADAGARGADAGRFLSPGHARHAAAQVADATIVIDVAPRNLRTAW